MNCKVAFAAGLFAAALLIIVAQPAAAAVTAATLTATTPSYTGKCPATDCALVAVLATTSLAPTSASTSTSGGAHPCVGCVASPQPAAPHLVITLDTYNPSGTSAIYALWRHDPPADDWVDVPYTITNKGNAVAPAGAATIVKINGVVLAFRGEQALNAGASRDSKIQFRLNNHNVKRRQRSAHPVSGQ